MGQLSEVLSGHSFPGGRGVERGGLSQGIMGCIPSASRNRDLACGKHYVFIRTTNVVGKIWLHSTLGINGQYSQVLLLLLDRRKWTRKSPKSSINVCERSQGETEKCCLVVIKTWEVLHLL